MEIQMVKGVLEELARQNGVPLAEVYSEIERVMLAGLLSDDPAIQKRWERVPRSDGALPTAEEFIFYAAGLVQAEREEAAAWDVQAEREETAARQIQGARGGRREEGRIQPFREKTDAALNNK